MSKPPPRSHQRVPLVVFPLALLGCWTGATADTTPSVSQPSAANHEATGSPPASHRPARRSGAHVDTGCDISIDPPVRATSQGELRIDLPAGDVLTSLSMSSQGPNGSMSARLQVGTGLATSLPLAPGTYVIDVETQSGVRARCERVAIAAGGATTIHLAP
jgi:hypothetical protein